MINLKTLEKLRSKEEVLDYFKQLGKNITEEEIDKLKASYEQAEQNNSNLTLEQLDDVAGGVIKGYVIIDLKKNTRQESQNETIHKINLLFTSEKEEFDGYMFSTSKRETLTSHDVYFLENEHKVISENTTLIEKNLENIIAIRKYGKFVESLIDSKEEYSAIKVGDDMYFYNIHTFQNIDKETLENDLKNQKIEKVTKFNTCEKVGLVLGVTIEIVLLAGLGIYIYGTCEIIKNRKQMTKYE